jgi:dihydroneopterin aldolase
LCQRIDDLARDEQYSLLERFAARVAEVVLSTPLVVAATVNVRKVRPPVPQHLSSSGVCIHRTKS